MRRMVFIASVAVILWAIAGACAVQTKPAAAGAAVESTAPAANSPRAPEGFRAKEGTTAEPYTGTDWAKEIVHDKTGLEMVFIPAGAYVMGSPETEVGRNADEGPQHKVKITKPFYLGKYEVTVGEFTKFTDAAIYRTEAECGTETYVWTGKEWATRSGVYWSAPGFPQTDRHPVVCVSWNDAMEFCRWGGLALPTEAQWEYACRAGTTTAYQWGDNADGGDGWGNMPDESAKRQWPDMKAASWNDGYATTAPVGSFRPDAWGLYDMHGNVYEWCSDWYDKAYYQASPSENPAGPVYGKSRSLHGGSWFHSAERCRSATRFNSEASLSSTARGFRAMLAL